MIPKFACVVIDLERLQNDNEDIFAKQSSFKRRQSDIEDSFVKKLIKKDCKMIKKICSRNYRVWKDDKVIMKIRS